MMHNKKKGNNKNANASSTSSVGGMKLIKLATRGKSVRINGSTKRVHSRTTAAMQPLPMETTSCDTNSSDSGLGFEHHADPSWSHHNHSLNSSPRHSNGNAGSKNRNGIAQNGGATSEPGAKCIKLEAADADDSANDNFSFAAARRRHIELPTSITVAASNTSSASPIGRSGGGGGGAENVNSNPTNNRNPHRGIGLASRRSLGPVSLASQLSSSSRDGRTHLEMLCQPEQQHRARYQTEGSRGAVKDRTGTGFPSVRLVGYGRPTTLQVFIGTDQGRVGPHMFYQACRVSGKNSTPCSERTVEGTVVIEVAMDPTKDMLVVCDCVGILKERNVDVEHRFPEQQAAARAKKKSTKCRLIFRTCITNSEGHPEWLQICSQPIVCTQPPGVPEICKKSLTTSPVTGGTELFIFGKNFLKDTRVVFEQEEISWEVCVQPDKEFLQQTHLVCVVPPYRRLDITEPARVRLSVASSGKTSESHSFTYLPTVPPATVQSQSASNSSLGRVGYMGSVLKEQLMAPASLIASPANLKVEVMDENSIAADDLQGMDLRMKGSDEATFQGFIPSVRNGSPLPTQTGQSVEKYLSNLTATKSAQQLTILPSNTLSSRKKTLFGEKVLSVMSNSEPLATSALLTPGASTHRHQLSPPLLLGDVHGKENAQLVNSETNVVCTSSSSPDLFKSPLTNNSLVVNLVENSLFDNKSENNQMKKDDTMIPTQDNVNAQLVVENHLLNRAVGNHIQKVVRKSVKNAVTNSNVINNSRVASDILSNSASSVDNSINAVVGQLANSVEHQIINRVTAAVENRILKNTSNPNDILTNSTSSSVENQILVQSVVDNQIIKDAVTSAVGNHILNNVVSNSNHLLSETVDNHIIENAARSAVENHMITNASEINNAVTNAVESEIFKSALSSAESHILSSPNQILTEAVTNAVGGNPIIENVAMSAVENQIFSDVSNVSNQLIENAARSAVENHILTDSTTNQILTEAVTTAVGNQLLENAARTVVGNHILNNSVGSSNQMITNVVTSAVGNQIIENAARTAVENHIFNNSPPNQIISEAVISIENQIIENVARNAVENHILNNPGTTSNQMLTDAVATAVLNNAISNAVDNPSLNNPPTVVNSIEAMKNSVENKILGTVTAVVENEMLKNAVTSAVGNHLLNNVTVNNSNQILTDAVTSSNQIVTELSKAVENEIKNAVSSVVDSQMLNNTSGATSNQLLAEAVSNSVEKQLFNRVTAVVESQIFENVRSTVGNQMMNTAVSTSNVLNNVEKQIINNSVPTSNQILTDAVTSAVEKEILKKAVEAVTSVETQMINFTSNQPSAQVAVTQLVQAAGTPESFQAAMAKQLISSSTVDNRSSLQITDNTLLQANPNTINQALSANNSSPQAIQINNNSLLVSSQADLNHSLALQASLANEMDTSSTPNNSLIQVANVLMQNPPNGLHTSQTVENILKNSSNTQTTLLLPNQSSPVNTPMVIENNSNHHNIDNPILLSSTQMDTEPTPPLNLSPGNSFTIKNMMIPIASKTLEPSSKENSSKTEPMQQEMTHLSDTEFLRYINHHTMIFESNPQNQSY